VVRVIARMNVGGPAVQVSGLMRGLDPGRFDHHLLTGTCGEEEADYLITQAPDVPATRVPGLGRRVAPTDDARALATLIGHMRRLRPDIVHTHTAKAGVLGRVAASVAAPGARLVHTFHGHLLHGYFPAGVTGVVTGVERLLAQRTDALIAVGQQVADDLVAAGIGRQERYRVIPPGLTLGDLPGRVEARRALGLPAEGVVVAMIGRLTGIKRPDRFLDVVAATTATPGSTVHFAVAGGGALAEVMRERVAAERLPVAMLGWQDAVEPVLAASDIVLLTSDNEGTPLSLIQAGMAGLPVVATAVGSVGDVVDDGVTGLLCPLTVHDLAAAIDRLAGDAPLRAHLGAAARERTTARYGVGRLVADHAKVYEDLLTDRRARLRRSTGGPPQRPNEYPEEAI